MNSSFQIIQVFTQNQAKCNRLYTVFITFVNYETQYMEYCHFIALEKGSFSFHPYDPLYGYYQAKSIIISHLLSCQKLHKSIVCCRRPCMCGYVQHIPFTVSTHSGNCNSKQSDAVKEF